jgi:hypothetical protein
MGDFYTHSGFPTTRAAGLSASARAEFALIQAGFDKLPSLSGNANKVVVVNSGATGLTVTSASLVLSGSFTKAASHALTLTTTATTDVTLPTTGTLATLAGTESLTNKTIGNGSTIVTNTQGGHAIGGAAVTGVGLSCTFVRTGPGSGSAVGLGLTNTLTGGVSDLIVGTSISLTAAKAGSGTHASIDTLLIAPPSISGAASATTACGLRITGAPGAGATNLYALRVDSGAVSFAGTLSVTGTLSPLGLLDISGASAGQIKFPASQNASADANTLDDYEEGSWTPSLGGSATYTSRGGRYTKIGNMVTIWGFVAVNAIGTGSTTTITGAPFTAANVTNLDFIGSAILEDSATNVTSIISRVQANSTSVTFPAFTGAADGHVSPAIFQNSTSVIFCVSYMI